MTRHFLLPYTNEVPFIMRMSLFWTKIAAAANITQYYIHFTFIPYFFITHSLGLGQAKARPEIWPAGHGF